MKNILLLGGTGFVGRHVCAKLAQQEIAVTVATRRASRARSLRTLPRLTVAEVDVHDEAALTRCLAGHDAVVNLVAILHGDAAAFERTHVQLPQTLARACAAAGVARVLHVSALGAAADAPSLYQRSKAAGEAALLAAPLSLTVLRPSVVFGAEDQFLDLFAQLQRWLPLLPLAGAACQFQPVWVEDVAQALVNALLQRKTGTYEACGPQVFSLRQLVQLAGQWSGHPRPVLELPPGLGRLQAQAMEWLPGPTLMSRDNALSLQSDNIASGELPGLTALGITPTALEAVAPAYLAGWGPRSGLLGLRTMAGRG